MKHLLCWLFFSALIYAQNGSQQNFPGAPLQFVGAPTGTCNATQVSLNTSNGDFYDCPSGSWVKAGAVGAGSGSVTSVTFTGDGTVLSSTPSAAVTTSGTVTGSLANAGAGTVLGNSTGSPAAPTYAALVNGQIANSTIDLTAKVTGALPQANGGNGINALAGTDSGTSTAYVVTGTPVVTLTNGLAGCFMPGNANGATPTVAFNGLTAKTIVKLPGNTALATSDMVTTQAACMVYNGTNFELLNPQGTTGTGKTVLQGAPSFTTGITTSTLTTATNCSSSASPAVCSSAAAGSVAVPTGTNPTLVVNTTAVTANSQIFVQSDDSLGTKLSITCNSTLASLAVEPVVTARSGGTSFTIQINGVISTNAVCLSYFIVN